MIEGIHHHCIIVSDLERSIRFYRDTLGLRLNFTNEGVEVAGALGFPKGVESVYTKEAHMQAGNDHVELIQYVKPKGKPFDRLPCDVGNMHIGLRVSDVDKVYEELKQKGVKFNSSPNKVTEGPLKGWTWVYLQDPDGATIEFVEER